MQAESPSARPQCRSSCLGRQSASGGVVGSTWLGGSSGPPWCTQGGRHVSRNRGPLDPLADQDLEDGDPPYRTGEFCRREQHGPRRNDIDRAAFRPPPSRAGAEGIGRTVGPLGRLGSRVMGAGGGWNREDTGEDERAGHRDPAQPDRPEPRKDRPEEHGRRGRTAGTGVRSPASTACIKGSANTRPCIDKAGCLRPWLRYQPSISTRLILVWWAVIGLDPRPGCRLCFSRPLSSRGRFGTYRRVV